MSSTGTWLVLFQRERAPRVDAVLERVCGSYGCAFEKPSEEHFRITINDKITKRIVSIEGGLNASPTVIRESEEIADDYAQGAPMHDAIARCDARWELTFDLRDSDETYNVLLGISEAMHEMSGAFVLVASEERLLEL